MASAYVLRPLSNTALGFWEWISAEGRNYVMRTKRLWGILVDIRTDFTYMFSGVFIAKNESGSGGHMRGGHMTGDRKGETNFKRNAG